MRAFFKQRIFESSCLCLFLIPFLIPINPARHFGKAGKYLLRNFHIVLYLLKCYFLQARLITYLINRILYASVDSISSCGICRSAGRLVHDGIVVNEMA